MDGHSFMWWAGVFALIVGAVTYFTALSECKKMWVKLKSIDTDNAMRDTRLMAFGTAIRKEEERVLLFEKILHSETQGLREELNQVQEHNTLIRESHQRMSVRVRALKEKMIPQRIEFAFAKESPTVTSKPPPDLEKSFAKIQSQLKEFDHDFTGANAVSNGASKNSNEGPTGFRVSGKISRRGHTGRG